jgi:hypothetical protein
MVCEPKTMAAGVAQATASKACMLVASGKPGACGLIRCAARMAPVAGRLRRAHTCSLWQTCNACRICLPCP